MINVLTSRYMHAGIIIMISTTDLSFGLPVGGALITRNNARNTGNLRTLQRLQPVIVNLVFTPTIIAAHFIVELTALMSDSTVLNADMTTIRAVTRVFVYASRTTVIFVEAK